MADNLTKEVIKEICATGDKTTRIPDTTEIGSNALSYADGFPIATSTPQSDGGIPPKRQDMNKVLNILSKNQVFLQNGGVYSYDSEISTAIGGYPKGAILKFSKGLNHYDIKALKNSPNEPVEDILGNTGNIYFARKIEQMYRIVATQNDLPTPSAETYGKMCFVTSENSFYIGGRVLGGSYTWENMGNNLYEMVRADVFTYDNITFYKQNSSYQWVDLGLSYDWLYFSPRAVIKEEIITGVRYRLWSNGWIEQYGIQVFNDTQYSTNFDVVFAIEMEDTTYDEHYTCEREAKSGAVNFGGGIRQKTTTGMNIQLLRVGSDDRCKSVSWKIEGFKALA